MLKPSGFRNEWFMKENRSERSYFHHLAHLSSTSQKAHERMLKPSGFRNEWFMKKNRSERSYFHHLAHLSSTSQKAHERMLKPSGFRNEWFMKKNRSESIRGKENTIRTRQLKPNSQFYTAANFLDCSLVHEPDRLGQSTATTCIGRELQYTPYLGQVRVIFGHSDALATESDFRCGYLLFQDVDGTIIKK
ncbi:hypothetical protein J6590_099809 [Homalodisca vitripennis]|nr:hypothetical protein J6590_099809 [Homalodisca vitripennis]